MKRLLLTLALVLLWSAPSLAQTGTPTSYVLRIYARGAATVTTTLPVPVSQWTCNQAPGGALDPMLGPRVWRIADPAQAGRECFYVDSRFAALADGDYDATIEATNADGSLGETARLPFTKRRPNPPAVPTGLRLTS